MLGGVAEVLGDVAVVRFEEDEDEAKENDLSWLDLRALFEKLNSLEKNPISGLAGGTVGLPSASYK